MANQVPAESWSLADQAAAMAFKGGTGLKQINSWFGPAAPLKPIAPDDAGWFRSRDYNMATNVNVLPKRLNEGVSYDELHALAENCDYVSVCIQTVQDRLSQHEGMIVDVGGDFKDRSAKAIEIDRWIRHPDGVTPLHSFVSQLVFDQCVIDAASVGIDRSGATPKALILDGATIAPRIDERGVVVGYQQIIKGAPAHDYDLSTIIWAPKNKRPHKLYGYSPVEQIYRIITLALRRTARQLDWFTDGAIPAMLISAPEGWNPEKIAIATQNWDELIRGTSGREQVKFIPTGAVPHVFDRNPAQDEFDSWLIRVICYAFSLPPTAFVESNNRATAETTQAASLAEGHAAMLRWTSDLLTSIVNLAFGPGFEWRWDLSVQPSIASTIELLKVGALKPQVLQSYGYDADVISDSMPAPAPSIGASPSSYDVPDDPAPPVESTTEGSVTNADSGQEIKNAAGPKPSADFTAVLEDYLADLQDSAIAAGIKAYETGAAVHLEDKQGIALKVVHHLANAFGDGINKGHKVIQVDDVDQRELSKLATDYARDKAAILVGCKINSDGEIVDNPHSEWSIAQTARDSVHNKVVKAHEEGWTPSQLREAIAQDPTFSPDRALMIARTETAAAQSSGAVTYYKSAGVEYKEWSDQDGCDICQANAAQGPIRIDESFDSGDDYAPAHPNCTCTVLPVVGDSIIKDEEQE